jgi:hypothetical protein
VKINSVQAIAIKSSFGFCLGLIGLVAPPATAESVNKSVNKNQTQENRANRLASFQPRLVSTQAQDLLIPLSGKQSDSVNPVTNRLAQRELNLTQFCQNYPYNSQCSGVTPSGEPGLERSPEQIPVPQAESGSSQSKSGWAIVPEVNTLGLGGNIVRKITSNFNARVGVNGFGTGIDVNETEFDYEGDLNLFNVSTLIDIQPFKSSGFRLSAGLILGNNNIKGTADVSDRVADELGEVELNGETIDIRELNINNLATIDADIDLNKDIAPYVGIGGGNAVGAGKGVGFWWNLGVVFSGSPEATVSSNFSAEIPAELRDEVVAAADETLKDEEKDLNDELDLLGVYPVLSLGLSYQF